MVHTRSASEEYSCRMLKKLVQQGRREFGDRSVPLGYVAGRRATENDAWEKTRLGAPGRAGEKSGFFSILSGFFLPEEERAIQSRDGDSDELDRQQQPAHDGVRCRWVQDKMQTEEFGRLRRRGFPGWKEKCEGQ